MSARYGGTPTNDPHLGRFLAGLLIAALIVGAVVEAWR